VSEKRTQVVPKIAVLALVSILTILVLLKTPFFSKPRQFYHHQDDRAFNSTSLVSLVELEPACLNTDNEQKDSMQEGGDANDENESGPDTQEFFGTVSLNSMLKLMSPFFNDFPVAGECVFNENTSINFSEISPEFEKIIAPVQKRRKFHEFQKRFIEKVLATLSKLASYLTPSHQRVISHDEFEERTLVSKIQEKWNEYVNVLNEKAPNTISCIFTEAHD
jgi:hypothetical protein